MLIDLEPSGPRNAINGLKVRTIPKAQDQKGSQGHKLEGPHVVDDNTVAANTPMSACGGSVTQYQPLSKRGGPNSLLFRGAISSSSAPESNLMDLKRN